MTEKDEEILAFLDDIQAGPLTPYRPPKESSGDAEETEEEERHAVCSSALLDYNFHAFTSSLRSGSQACVEGHGESQEDFAA